MELELAGFDFQSRRTCVSSSVNTNLAELDKKRPAELCSVFWGFQSRKEFFTMAQARESPVVELMAELTMAKNNEGGEMVAQLPIANINEKLPPELLTGIFQFLPYDDLKNALLVCRWVLNNFKHAIGLK